MTENILTVHRREPNLAAIKHVVETISGIAEDCATMADDLRDLAKLVEPDLVGMVRRFETTLRDFHRAVVTTPRPTL